MRPQGRLAVGGEVVQASSLGRCGVALLVASVDRLGGDDLDSDIEQSLGEGANMRSGVLPRHVERAGSHHASHAAHERRHVLRRDTVDALEHGGMVGGDPVADVAQVHDAREVVGALAELDAEHDQEAPTVFVALVPGHVLQVVRDLRQHPGEIGPLEQGRQLCHGHG